MNSTLVAFFMLLIATVSAKHIESRWPYIEFQGNAEDVSTRSAEGDESQEAQKRLIEFKRIIEFKRDLEKDMSDLDLYIEKILDLKKMYQGHRNAKRPSIISGTRSIHGTRSFN